MAKFNDVESMHELELSPDKLREIATQLEHTYDKAHHPGQVIRYKVSHNFCLMWKPMLVKSGYEPKGDLSSTCEDLSTQNVN